MFLQEVRMGWTDERVATLKLLWLAGLSASQVARRLGGVTRNAVIGKVHRLGLSERASASAPTHRSNIRSNLDVVPRKPRAPQTGSARGGRSRKIVTDASEPSKVITRQGPKCEVDRPLEFDYVERFEEPGSATVMTLGAHMCKWPIGDPSSDDFTFCGRKVGQDGPYCSSHACLAYQPHQVRRRGGPASELARSLRRHI